MAGKGLGVTEFFRGKNVLISGASGFLGKVVLHKLLTTVPDVGDIYVMVRAKRGVTAQDRVKQILEAVIFDDLRKSNPGQLAKVRLVEGDVMEPALAMSEAHAAELAANVNVVFHAAADVTFDRLLSEAFNLNVEGTRRMLELAKRMDNLEVFVHVSTAYSYCVKKHIDDGLYSEPSLNGHSIEGFREMEKDPKFDRKKFVGSWPNTYCYTKAIAEQMVQEYADALPIVMVRPSIIIGAVRDPVPGWAEGAHGMNGCIIGCATGFVDSMNGKGESLADVIPVDIVSNMMVAAAVERARNGNANNNVILSKKEGSASAVVSSDGSASSIPVYNCVSGPYNPISWNELVKLTSYWSRVHPTEGVLWVPEWNFYDSHLRNRVHMALRTGLPSFVLDLFRRLSGARPRFFRMYERFQKVDAVLHYFVTHEWRWANDSTQRLLDSMSEEEKQVFKFDLTGHDWSTYMEQVVRGVRTYLLKMRPSTLPASRRRMDNLRRLKDLTILAATAGPAYWVLSYHARNRDRGGAPAALLSLIMKLYRLLLLPSSAARALLLASARKIAAFKPLAVTMSN